MATVVTPMTTEELLELPENGVRRWLIDGELRESPMPVRNGGELRESPMTVRNRFHSRAMICVGTELELWLRQQPTPRGQIIGGEAGVRILHDPDTTVGIDVGYISHEVIAKQTDASTLVIGVPILIVEILSPSATHEEMLDKLAAYRRAKVPVVWILDPYLQTVTVHRAKGKPRMFNADDELSGEPQLPGFSVPVARLFD
jgi:Uma2 family endonuclease